MKKLPKFYALVMQVSNNIYLLVSGEIQYATYIVGLEVIKARGEGDSFLSQRHFIAEATSPVRRENKELRTEAGHSSP
jgi:hypothetical protein